MRSIIVYTAFKEHSVKCNYAHIIVVVVVDENYDCCGREKVGRFGRTVCHHCVMPPQRRAITAVTTAGHPCTAAATTTTDDATNSIFPKRPRRTGPANTATE